MSTRQKESRSGVTIVETIALMLTIGLVLTLSANLLSRAMGMQNDLVQHFHVVQGMKLAKQRIATDLKTASAKDADVKIDNGAILTLAKGQVTVRYRVEDSVLLRDTIENDEVLSTDRFLLPASASAHWRYHPVKHRSLIDLELRFEGARSTDNIQWWWSYPADAGSPADTVENLDSQAQPTEESNSGAASQTEEGGQ